MSIFVKLLKSKYIIMTTFETPNSFRIIFLFFLVFIIFVLFCFFLIILKHKTHTTEHEDKMNYNCDWYIIERDKQKGSK